MQVYQSTVNLVPQTAADEEKEEEKRGFDRNGFNQFMNDRNAGGHYHQVIIIIIITGQTEN